MCDNPGACQFSGTAVVGVFGFPKPEEALGAGGAGSWGEQRWGPCGPLAQLLHGQLRSCSSPCADSTVAIRALYC